MNPNTGHLVADLNSVPAAERDQYQKIPEALERDAEAELKGKREVQINLAHRSNLAQWAKNERKKNRTRAKIAKKARKAGRK